MRRVKTVVQPQNDHDWKLLIQHGGMFYMGGGQPGWGWTSDPWVAKKFSNRGDIRDEIAKWEPGVVPGEVTIRRVWTCVGEERGKLPTPVSPLRRKLKQQRPMSDFDREYLF